MRPSQAGVLYNTSIWQRARRAFLLLNPRCVVCADPAQVVDHEPPHLGNHAAFWDTSTWQPMCMSCHGRKTSAQNPHTARNRMRRGRR